MYLDTKIQGVLGHLPQSYTDARKRDDQAFLGTSDTATSTSIAWDGNTASTWLPSSVTDNVGEETSYVGSELWTQPTPATITDWSSQATWEAESESTTWSTLQTQAPVSFAWNAQSITVDSAYSSDWQTEATDFIEPSSTDSIQVSPTISSAVSPVDTVADSMALTNGSSATLSLVADKVSAFSSAPPASSPTTQTDSNTWITSSTTIPIPSGQTVTPIFTFAQQGTAAFGSSDGQSVSTATGGTSAPSIVQSTNRNGAASVHTGNKVNIGIIVGTICGLFIIILAALVYIRGGMLRGMPYKRKEPGTGSPIFSTRKKSIGPAWFRGSRQTQPLQESPDLEIAKLSPVMQPEVEDEKWVEVDVNDANSGDMEEDSGEWLEEWRRRKEAMMSKPAPELRLNPELPLPTISTRTLACWDEHS